MSTAISLEVGTGDLSQASGAAMSNLTIPRASRYFVRSSWLSRLVGLLLLIPAAPAIGFLALLTRLTSKGAGLYPQTRVGLHGQTFTLYKIRSMRQDAETGTGPVWAQIRDPRITFLGRILRSTHMDELPQLFNVVKGEMSLVGPRPERPEFTQFLAREIPGYVQRLAVRPGISGLAQINLPPDTDVESVRKKLALDLEYIRTANLWMDLRIVLCTAVRLVGIKGLTMAGLLGLRRKPREIMDASPSIYAKAPPALANGGACDNTDSRNDRVMVSAEEPHVSLSPPLQRREYGEPVVADSSSSFVEVQQ